MSGKTANAFETMLRQGLEDNIRARDLLSDEACLDVMRSIIKEYVAYRQSNRLENEMSQAYKNRYEEYRQQVRDEALRAYTAFEFMEKLYWQEYLVQG